MAEGGENISVAIRVRPLNARELAGEEKTAWKVVEGKSLVSTEHNSRQGQAFSFGESCSVSVANPFAGS